MTRRFDDAIRDATPRPDDEDRGPIMLGRLILAVMFLGVLVIIGVTAARAVEKAAFDAVHAENMQF